MLFFLLLFSNRINIVELFPLNPHIFVLPVFLSLFCLLLFHLHFLYKVHSLPFLPTRQSEKLLTSLKKKALNQCARELLLAQSSDWLFIITHGTMVDYAKKRIKDHIGRFTKLYYQIKEDNIDEEFLKDIMKKDKIFPDIDYMLYY